jgi:hypothetical protein
MGFFTCFSRCPEADSKARQNRDSARIFCLTRIGDSAKDISASDQVYPTEKGAVFPVQSIIDQVLGGQRPRSPNASQ